MSRSLLADTVVTCPNQRVEIHSPGQIDIDDSGRVAYAGARRTIPAAAATDCGGLLMPGLVNAHGHAPMVLLRGVGDGLPLDRWLNDAIWPREARLGPGDVEWGMRLASAEMLLAGVTTSCDMYFDDAAMIEAVLATGGRHVCTPGVVGAVHLTSSDSLDLRVREIRDLHARYHDLDGRIAVGVGPHSPYDLPLDVVTDLASLARDLETILHLHVAETAGEGAELEAAQQCSTVAALDRCGVFEGHVLTAHSVWVTEDDIATYAERGVHVAHCPTSNMKLGSGVAPIHQMTEHGVNVALGTDGAASNDDLDLWDELALAPLLARVNSLSPGRLSVEQALLMATANGAAAIGSNTGSLAVGSWADIVRIDTDRPSWHPIDSSADIVERLVFSTKSRDVTDVWVAGDRVVENRALTTIDVDEAIEQVTARARRLRP
ncbi:MAG: amidohydrolase [Actinomycetia bacterium]|nr:amidohydrolase [Actinomycetes bacterium]